MQVRLVALAVAIAFVVLSGSCDAEAGTRPFVSREVAAKITGRALAREKFGVVIVYRSAPSLQRPSEEPFLREEMRRWTRHQEDAVFKFDRRGALVERMTLWLANSTVARLDISSLRQVLSDPRVAAVYPADGKGHLAIDRPARNTERAAERWSYGLEKIGIVNLWTLRPELTGKSVRVGIIDTGISPVHPRLRGRTKAFRNFISPRDSEAMDDNGHGTHVAGTIAGGPDFGFAIGVAPEADLLIAKAFSAYGGSEDSYLLEALQWLADPDGNPQTRDGAEIISGSWNVDGEIGGSSPEHNPFCIAISNLWKLGIVSVFAAGNDGPNAGSIKVPGACPEAVTVAASDEDDRIADFSSRGPVQWKTGRISKPDITAPGVAILSADYEGDTRAKSGTSMATPHISGAFALLKQAYPGDSPEQLRARLLSGASVFQPAEVWGAGRAQIVRSISP